MASLSEVYGARGVAPRQLWAGVGLFAVGVVLVAAGVLAATTDLLTDAGVHVFVARRVAGVLAGLGLPAAMLGVVAVLPASRRVRATAGLGTAVAVLGVALFAWAYPHRWIGGSGPNATPLVVAVYAFGALVACVCLFWTVATFKARSDPGGTVHIEVTDAGTRVVSASGDIRRRLGGVGFLGATPDGDTPTQTATRGGQTVSDGGATADAGDASLADPYCGNCAHFSYVRVDGEIEPYCGRHDERMADMDACEHWEPNT
ncbi:MAG: hypothetical protein ABEJ23_05630 [Haloarculaceae archaeon]